MLRWTRRSLRHTGIRSAISTEGGELHTNEDNFERQLIQFISHLERVLFETSVLHRVSRPRLYIHGRAQPHVVMLAVCALASTSPHYYGPRGNSEEWAKESLQIIFRNLANISVSNLMGCPSRLRRLLSCCTSIIGLRGNMSIVGCCQDYLPEWHKRYNSIWNIISIFSVDNLKWHDYPFLNTNLDDDLCGLVIKSILSRAQESSN